MSLRIYLDTSVLSALGDVRAPDRQSLTREFFGRVAEFRACTSELARIEIERTRDDRRRTEMLALLQTFQVHPVTAEAESLAQRYMDASIIPASVPEDALSRLPYCSGKMLSYRGTSSTWSTSGAGLRSRR